MYLKILIITPLLCALFYSSAGFGEEKVFVNDPVVITAAGYETSVSKEGKDITIITSEEIQDSGKKDLADVLESVPGITVSRQGTDGGTENLFIRGSKSGNILIMIDGIKINNPIGIGRVVDLSLLKVDNIERIEVVEGAMSSMYGSEASGGVINIITKKGTGNYIFLSAEGGAYNTLIESVAVSERTENMSFYFSGSHYTSGGISQAKDMNHTGGFDKDSSENTSAFCKMDSSLWDKTNLSFNMNFANKKTDIDNGAGQDDPNNKMTGRIFTGGIDFRHTPFDCWNYKLGLSYTALSTINSNPADPGNTYDSSSTFNSSSYKINFINNFTIFKANVLSVGAEVLSESGSDTSFFYNPSWAYYSDSIIQDKTMTTKSFFVHDSTSLFNMLFFNLGGRLDNYYLFGNHYTWDVSAAFIIPVTKTKLRASAGSGFKVPSLYELYDGTYGNIDLKPERSYVYDAGIYQELFNGTFDLGCTFFYQEYKDMLGYNPVTYQSINLNGELDDRGVEVSAGVKLTDILRAKYSYTHLSYTKNDTDQPVYKMPKDKHTASLTLKPVRDLTVTASYIFAGSRVDYGDYKLDSYQKIDMNVRYRLNETLTFKARGENLTNAKYMETYGYNTYGRSFYGGLEIMI